MQGRRGLGAKYSGSLSDGLGSSLSHAAEEEALDVGEGTASGNGSSGHQFVELVIVADGDLQVARIDDWCLLIRLALLGSLASDLNDLSGDVLEDCGGKDTSSLSNLLGIAASLEHGAGATDWED